MASDRLFYVLELLKAIVVFDLKLLMLSHDTLLLLGDIHYLILIFLGDLFLLLLANL
jgi:hypothetical protein